MKRKTFMSERVKKNVIHMDLPAERLAREMVGPLGLGVLAAAVAKEVAQALYLALNDDACV
jgi:hypothetical protein